MCQLRRNAPLAALFLCPGGAPRVGDERKEFDPKPDPQRTPEYPDGLTIGDQFSSQAGEFLRYANVSESVPTEKEQYETLKMGADLRCDVCNTMVRSLMQKAESNSEDHIMDQLEGVPAKMPEMTEDLQANRLNKARKGCNKHFKDEIVLKGYFVWRCAASKPADKFDRPEVPKTPIEFTEITILPSNANGAADDKPDSSDGENLTSERRLAAAVLKDTHNAANEPESTEEELTWHGTREWCLAGPIPGHTTEEQANTYDKEYDAIYHACEHTIGRYGDDLGRFLAGKLEDGAPLWESIHEGCREIANCERYRIRKAGLASSNKTKNSRPRSTSHIVKQKSEKKIAKRRKTDGDEEKSYLQLLKEDKDVANKDKRKRRGKAKTTAHEMNQNGYFNIFDGAKDVKGAKRKPRKNKFKAHAEL